MLLILDVKCEECGNVFEVFGKRDDTYRCVCGGDAKRIISPVRCKLSGHGDFPGEAMKWAKRHEKEAKRGDNH